MNVFTEATCVIASMNYLQSLLALDASAIASFDPEYNHSGLERGYAKASSFVLEALWREALTTATFVAVSANIANALANPATAKVASRHALQTYVTPEMPVFTTTWPGMINGDMLPELLAPYQAFADRVGLARRMALAYVHEAKVPFSDQTVDLTTLQDALANACCAALVLLAELGSARREHGTDGDELRAHTSQRQLIQLLIAASHGAHPCVEADGCVVIPGWAERRRHQRQTVDFPVEVHAFERVWTARAFDVARGGLGLDGAGELQPGDAIALKVPDGRLFRANTAWVSGSKAGVCLLQPLAAGDPLISG